MSYEESLKEESDSVFMRVIKEADGRSWQISPIKRSLNGAKFSRTSIIMGFITAEKWSGWEIWSARMLLPSPDLHTGSADAMPEMWS